MTMIMKLISDPSLRILSAMWAGFILDCLLGDPHWLYHPVRLIGKLISILERRIRRRAKKSRFGLRIGGIILVILTAGLTTVCTALIVFAAGRIHVLLGWLVMAVLDYWLFAARSLRSESMKVYKALVRNDLEGARSAVAMIVGRDTDRLDAQGVAKAAVETVAENTSDGVIAPLLCMALGGPVLGWLYKSINTMDSMIGYKDLKYRYIGRCAARLDDVVNFIPARVSALIMIIACPLVRLDMASGWRIFRRDRYHHASPNSAQTESVMAGALGVQLAGDAWYFGKLYHKETIGDPDRAVDPADIRRANRLMYATTLVTLLLCTGLRLLIGMF